MNSRSEKRLIDADALTDAVEHINWYHISLQGTLAKGANSQLHTPLYKADDIYSAINDAPTVDAVEVVHGRWVGTGQWNHKPYRMKNKEKWQTYLCSECGHSNGRRFNDKYCPNCGAKMDGDGNA